MPRGPALQLWCSAPFVGLETGGKLSLGWQGWICVGVDAKPPSKGWTHLANQSRETLAAKEALCCKLRGTSQALQPSVGSRTCPSSPGCGRVAGCPAKTRPPTKRVKIGWTPVSAPPFSPRTPGLRVMSVGLCLCRAEADPGYQPEGLHPLPHHHGWSPADAARAGQLPFPEGSGHLRHVRDRDLHRRPGGRWAA